MSLRTIIRSMLLPLSAVLAAGTLTGCALRDLTRDCDGTDDRVKETAALGILDSRPTGATVARGFEEVDAGCWADSGDVSVYAERTYAFPGTRTEVTAHYRAAAVRDGWDPDPEAPPGGLCFVKDDMALRVVFLTAERLEEYGYGDRPDLIAGAGYSVGVDSFVGSGGEAGC
ncbi:MULTISPECIES: hypothetical protein [unclassified Streptomyces]|uniref:hypothetical protein n=1 Tax=unclassified Streptomyces TaxID=2593676 RepID=UPI00093AC4C7|nr:hypothetical protein [Streptomyces sp. CB02400]OKK11444.1 hypothetical protein AMK33_08405 [Streptomyces sp. CB02400]